MDVICSTGFGLDASAQRDHDNPFVKHSMEILDFEGASNPIFLIGSKTF